MVLVRALIAGTLTLSAFATDDVKEVAKTVQLSLDGRVTIDTYKGSIQITSWDSPQVEIHARIESDEGFFSSGTEGVKYTEVRIDSSPASVRIKSDYSRVRRGWFGATNLPLVHYRIKMPRTARLDIKDYKSKIEAAGLRSEVAIETYKGSAVVSDLDGSIDLETYKGDARVSLVNLKRKSRLETYKGAVELAVPAGSGFDLESDLGRRASVSSDFDLQAVSRKGPHSRTQFSGTVNGGGPKIYLKSHKGTIRLRRVK